MLFESRAGAPEVSEPWRETRDQFLSGRTRDACRGAEALRGQTRVATGNDLVLQIELARGAARSKTSQALARKGIRLFPDHDLVQIYYARALLARGLHGRASEFLEERESTLGTRLRALWSAELADVYGTAGYFQSARRWLREAEAAEGADEPLALYSRCCAYEALREWDAAAEMARRCAERAPRWMKARSLAVHCLLTQGRLDEARAELAAARSLGLEDAGLDVSEAMLQFSVGEFREARGAFERLLERWPDADFGLWARRTMGILLVETGDCDAARRLLGDRPERFGLPGLERAESSSGRKFIGLPLVAQHHKQCVPTSVAMAAWPLGRRLEPARLFREMQGREGTALWRMRDWAEGQGLAVIPVRLELDTLKRALDLELPLIGVAEAAFSSHVEVICGYHEGLEVLYVRDPMHWAPVAYPYEMALKRYELYGALAVVEAGDVERIAALEELRSEPTTALLDLAAAVARGDLAAAEAAFGQIPDEHPTAAQRDGVAYEVVLSQRKFVEALRRRAADEDCHGVTRFRALLALGFADAQEAIERLLTDEGEKIGEAARRYLRLLAAMHHGRWEEARELIERLLLRGSGMSELWSLRSDLLAELGDRKGSELALARAMELEPGRLSYREKWLARSSHQFKFEEYLREFERMIEEDPDDKRLLWGRATTLADGPDGKAYEAAMLEYLRWRPRSESAYSQLMQWYRYQGREDLAEQMAAEAERLMPELRAESPPAESAATTPAATDAAAEEPVVAELVAAEPVVAELVASASAQGEAAQGEADQALPDDKGALLNLALRRGATQRGAAIAKLEALESSGELAWHERAALVAARMLVDGEEPSVDELSRWLPDPTPGAPQWFAGRVAELLSNERPGLRAARAVVEWLARVVPDYRELVDLWFNRVILLECAGQNERALSELQEMRERYPAYSSVHYRLGVVRFNQGDYAGARAHFERALEVNEGLVGAAMMLREVASTLGETAEALRGLARQRRKFPYEFAHYLDQVLATVDESGVAEARRVLAEGRADYPSERVDLLEARLLAIEGEYDACARILERMQGDGASLSDDLFEDWLRVGLMLADRREDVAEGLRWCEVGLSRWPDSRGLRERKAALSGAADPAESRRILRELWRESPADRSLAQNWLLVEERPGAAAREAIQELSPEESSGAIDACGAALSHERLLGDFVEFAEWGLTRCPDSRELKYRLAIHYDMAGNVERAVELSRSLWERAPEDVELLQLYGRCLIGRDPQEAVKRLEEASRENRSVDLLFDLARAYLVAGRKEPSRETHEEILRQHPFMAASLTNLFIMETPAERLWPYVAPMLEHGCGVQDEYFLVATVILAKQMRRSLPPMWIELARRRWRVLQTHPGFRDERLRLARAIRAWVIRRPQDRVERELSWSTWWDSVAAVTHWPRLWDWIPL